MLVSEGGLEMILLEQIWQKGIQPSRHLVPIFYPLFLIERYEGTTTCTISFPCSRYLTNPLICTFQGCWIDLQFPKPLVSLSVAPFFNEGCFCGCRACGSGWAMTAWCVCFGLLPGLFCMSSWWWMAERMRSTETLLALLDAFGSSLDVIFPKSIFWQVFPQEVVSQCSTRLKLARQFIQPRFLGRSVSHLQGQIGTSQVTSRTCFPVILDERANIGIHRQGGISVVVILIGCQVVYCLICKLSLDVFPRKGTCSDSVGHIVEQNHGQPCGKYSCIRYKLEKCIHTSLFSFSWILCKAEHVCMCNLFYNECLHMAHLHRICINNESTNQKRHDTLFAFLQLCFP